MNKRKQFTPYLSDPRRFDAEVYMELDLMDTKLQALLDIKHGAKDVPVEHRDAIAEKVAIDLGWVFAQARAA